MSAHMLGSAKVASQHALGEQANELQGAEK
jgi:hypothetical protein